MQRKIWTEVELGATVSSFVKIGTSSGIERSDSNFLNAGGKVKKNGKLTSTGTHDAGIVKNIPKTLKLVYQGMLEDIDTKEQPWQIWRI